MSDKYLYKAKTLKKSKGCALNNVWIEGDLIHSNGKYYIHPRCNAVEVKGELGKIIIMHEIDSSTICQSIGMRSHWYHEDEYQMEIDAWEHDILEVEYEDEKVLAEVRFDCGMFILVSKGFSDGYVPLFDYVIAAEGWIDAEYKGNIFDNWELLND